MDICLTCLKIYQLLPYIDLIMPFFVTKIRLVKSIEFSISAAQIDNLRKIGHMEEIRVSRVSIGNFDLVAIQMKI